MTAKRQPKPANYLRRDLHRLSGHLVLFTSEKAMEQELLRLNVHPSCWPKFPEAPGLAITVEMRGIKDRDIFMVVANVAHDDPVGMVGLLVHEAVHVFRLHCDAISEDKPSDEFQAYGIQAIADELIRELGRQAFGLKEKK